MKKKTRTKGGGPTGVQQKTPLCKGKKCSLFYKKGRGSSHFVTQEASKRGRPGGEEPRKRKHLANKTVSQIQKETRH